jgi:hypothetical protein
LFLGAKETNRVCILQQQQQQQAALLLISPEIIIVVAFYSVGLFVHVRATQYTRRKQQNTSAQIALPSECTRARSLGVKIVMCRREIRRRRVLMRQRRERKRDLSLHHVALSPSPVKVRA